MKYIVTSILLITLCFGMTSCSLFDKQDATPALVSLEKLDLEFQDTLDSLREVVTNATGLEPAVRSEILTSISTTQTFKNENIQSLRRYLESLGDIDYQLLFERLYKNYEQVKGKLKETP